MSLQLVKITDPFARDAKLPTSLPYEGPLSIQQVIDDHAPGVNPIAVLNGAIIPVEDWIDVYIQDEDEIILRPRVEDADTWRMIAMVAITVTAVATGQYYAAAWFGKRLFASFAAAAIAGGMIYAGGELVNALIPAPDPSLPASQSNEIAESQLYGWNPRTKQQVGGSIAYIYGTNKVRGNIISVFSEPSTANNKQVLNMLIALGRGPVSSVSNLKINDQNIANFDDVSYQSKTGLLEQAALSGFDKAKTETAPNTLVSSSSAQTIDIPAGTYDEFEVDLAFPYGLFHMKDDGNLENYSVRVLLEYKVKTDSDWIPVINTPTNTITNITLSGVYPVLTFDAAHTILNGEDVLVNQVQGMTELNGNRYSVRAKTSTTITLNVDASTFGAYTSGGIANATVMTITDRARNNVRRTFGPIARSGSNDYHIRVTKYTTDRLAANGENDTRYGDRLYVSTLRTNIDTKFQYPRLAYTAISALATEELSGSFQFSCDVVGRYCRTYDGTNWGVEATDNPAWVLFDILTQPVFTGNVGYAPTGSPPGSAFTVSRYDGIDPSSIDIEKFKELADHCDEVVYSGQKLATFNGIFDVDGTMWENATRVCQMCRCIPVWIGTQLSLAIDKPGTPERMFSVGNIEESKFKLTFLPQAERASEIEVSFNDAANNYDRTLFTIIDTSAVGVNNKVSLNLFGVTSAAEAWRLAKFRLNQNRLLTRTAEFSVDVDALTCSIGDIIKLQHDVAQWGLGGRIVAATSNTVTLDKIPVWDGVSTYEIVVCVGAHPTLVSAGKYKDQTVTKTVISVSGNVVTISDTFTDIPSVNDVYSYGVQGEDPPLFKIITIEQDSDQRLRIGAINYDPDVYASDSDAPEINTLNPYTATAVSVTDLTVDEMTTTNESGASVKHLHIGFRIPNSAAYDRADIYVQPDGIDSWWKVGETRGNYFKWYNPEPQQLYTIKVVGFNTAGQQESFTNAPSVAITTTGVADTQASYLTDKVGGLELFGQGNSNVFYGKDAKFVWNDINAVGQVGLAGSEPDGAGSGQLNVWLRDYEVIVYNPDNTIRRTEYVTSPQYTYTFEKNAEDGNSPARAFTVGVKARDHYYRTSARATKLAVSNPAPSTIEGVVVDDGQGQLKVSWQVNSELDRAGYIVYVDTTTPTEADEVWRGEATEIILQGAIGTYKIKVAAFDAFGDTSLNLSAEVTGYRLVVQPTIDIPATSGIIFTGSGANISWTAGTLTYKGVNYAITADGPYSHKYVYWNKNSGPTAFITTNTLATITGPDIWLMAYNAAGTVYLADARKIMHGGVIQAGTITATHLTTASAVITAQAQIASAIIGASQLQTDSVESAKIKALAVSEAKLSALAVSEGKLAALSVTTAKIGALAVTGAKIGNLAVDTLQIAGNAASFTVANHTDGIVTITTSETTLQSVSFTSTGIPVYINACAIHISPSGNHTLDFFLYRDSTLIWTITSVPDFRQYNKTPYNIIMKDTPSAGTYTYYWKAKRISGTSSSAAQLRTLSAYEFKK